MGEGRGYGVSKAGYWGMEEKCLVVAVEVGAEVGVS